MESYPPLEKHAHGRTVLQSCTAADVAETENAPPCDGPAPDARVINEIPDKQGKSACRAGPRSYVVNVEGTTYRRNRVDLRPAERVPQLPLGHLERPGDAHATEEGSVSEDSKEETGISHGGTPFTTNHLRATPSGAGPGILRSGRLIKPRDRLNL
ncbi:hypothetical protein DPEC_G00373420 [Dallia pectoralis]|nr:hypothetical protein DPEC_G00373420 [Dallia pectoralis]